MKIIFGKNDLIKAINISLRAIPTRSTMPILECILIEADKDIIFTSNDNDISIKTKAEGDIIAKGNVAVNAKQISEIVKKMPDSEIVVTFDNNQLSIKSDNANFSIPATSGDDFIRMREYDKSKFITISQFSLKEVIRQTIFSISDNSSSKMMSGEFFEVNDNSLKVVALDGHRIALRKIELKNSYDNIKAIVPGKTLNELSKIIGDDNEKDVNIYFSDNTIVFEFDDTIMSSRLIEGEYYKINQMISNNYDIKMKVNKKDLYNCIDRSTILIREGDKKPIIMNITEGNVEIVVKSSMGSMDEKVNIEKSGNDIMIGFNPKFLLDALRVIDDEYVDCYMVNSKYPCVIKNEDESYIYLILPVNVSA